MAFSRSGSEAVTSSSHRRRVSRGVNAQLEPLNKPQSAFGTKSISEFDQYSVGDTAAATAQTGVRDPMSLDHSPEPNSAGGWASPGLTTPVEEGYSTSRGRSPSKRYGDPGHHVSWATAKASSARVSGYPSYESQNQGYFGRKMRSLSIGLPQYFAQGRQGEQYAEKEKLGRGRRRHKDWRDLPRRLGLLMSRRRRYMLLAVIGLLFFLIWPKDSKMNP